MLEIGSVYNLNDTKKTIFKNKGKNYHEATKYECKKLEIDNDVLKQINIEVVHLKCVIFVKN